jgi:hypothetical protein
VLEFGYPSYICSWFQAFLRKLCQIGSRKDRKNDIWAQAGNAVKYLELKDAKVWKKSFEGGLDIMLYLSLKVAVPV